MLTVAQLERDAPGREDTVTSVRKEINDWVAKYRRDTTFSGRPSYGNTYSAVNALAGHVNSFGPLQPVPKKRLERLVKVGGRAGEGGGGGTWIAAVDGAVAARPAYRPPLLLLLANPPGAERRGEAAGSRPLSARFGCTPRRASTRPATREENELAGPAETPHASGLPPSPPPTASFLGRHCIFHTAMRPVQQQDQASVRARSLATGRRGGGTQIMRGGVIKCAKHARARHTQAGRDGG